MDEIKNIINDVISKISSQKPEQQSRIQDVWKKIVDLKGQQHSSIINYQDKRLIVNIDSSIWLFQFNLKRGKILKELQKEIPECENIIFRIGKT